MARLNRGGVPMIAPRAIAVLALGMAWAGPAPAQPLPPSRATHDVPYYATHGAERNATLKACRRDMSLDRNPDCMNAQMAETHQRARDTDDVFARMDRQMNDPEWWATDNTGDLLSRVKICDSGAPSNMTPSECAAVRGGLALQERARNAR
jgi:hypothetical protein